MILCGSPVPGEELVETAVWPEIDEMDENIGKVPVRIYAAELSLEVSISEATMAQFSAPSS